MKGRYRKIMADLFHERLQALAEPIRTRLLHLLARHELAVGELARALRTSQPSISRHLKQLDQAGFLQRRRIGTATCFRLDPHRLPEDLIPLWSLVEEHLEAERAIPQSPLHEDLRRAELVLAQRASSSEELFQRLGGRWDELRQELFGESHLVPVLLALLPRDRVVADLGCGTGVLLPLLAPHVREVIGIDREEAMLDVARQRIAGLPTARVERGQLDALPLADASVDLALCLLVLHHLREIGPVFRELRRVLRPGGWAVLVDMVEHGREELRQTMGHQHLGFSSASIAEWAGEAGLRLLSFQALPVDPQALGPGLWVGRLGLAEEPAAIS